jgi:hypothetical protein
MNDLFQTIALIASIILPLWNIPLIYRIIKRRSSQDVSLAWAIGVWICFALMFPAALNSQDKVWKVFSIVNMVFFTGVVMTVLAYHGRPEPPPSKPKT